jgi:hypothetical protein
MNLQRTKSDVFSYTIEILSTIIRLFDLQENNKTNFYFDDNITINLTELLRQLSKKDINNHSLRKFMLDSYNLLTYYDLTKEKLFSQFFDRLLNLSLKEKLEILHDHENGKKGILYCLTFIQKSILLNKIILELTKFCDHFENITAKEALENKNK